MTISATRIGDSPIIHQGMCESLGDNINGPSLIERPAWAPGHGRYLLYFSHHKGQHIRLAFTDRLEGPWTIHMPGVLPLASTPLAQTPPDVPQPDWAVAQGEDGLYPHLASPDVWVDEDTRQFRMIFHGLAPSGEQVSYRALSPDGLDWHVEGDAIPLVYVRRFVHGGQVYGLCHGGQLARERPDGGFDPGPFPIKGPIRHVAIAPRDDRAHVFFTRIGDAPERILHVELDLSGPWPDWRPCGPETEILRPALGWEGADEPVEASRIGAVGFSNQLRDPEVFEAEGQVWIIYAGGGEAALGLARIDDLHL